MSGMVGVLAAHWSRSTHADSEPFVDKCDGCGAVIYTWGDDPAWEGIEPLAAHQAAMLSAAGFGLVREAQAVALEEAADDFEFDRKQIATFEARKFNGIYVTKLRARAVTVRGGE